MQVSKVWLEVLIGLDKAAEKSYHSVELVVTFGVAEAMATVFEVRYSPI